MLGSPTTRVLALVCTVGLGGLAAGADPGPSLRYTQDGRGPLVINELMAVNGTFLRDPQAQYDDWIEIYNGSDGPTDVAGLYLAGDPAVPRRWQFPPDQAALTTILPRGFLVVWMDGDTADPGLHAGFKLDGDGDALYLFASDGRTLLDSIVFGAQNADVSYGRYPDAADDWQFMSVPTPGAPNVQGYHGRVADVRFSRERGFCDQPFEVAIFCDTPDAMIYYTTDGTAPYLLGGRVPSGIPYTKPIQITKTTCLRAAAIRQNWLAGNIVTQTYIFLQNVIQQPAQPSGFPARWQGAAADYEMDPQVVSDPRYHDVLADALLSIPTMSLVMAGRDLFDSTTGIYANPQNSGAAWERPGSVELIYPDGSEGFQTTCAVRIQGGWFRAPSASGKHSFRLLFKAAYGPSKLRYPLFGPEAADEFDTIVLRAGANDGYAWDAAYLTEQYTRDEFGRQLQAATGHAAVHGTFVHLYVNGLHWGLYNPCERPDASFSARYYGGDEDNWDALHDGSASNGDTGAWSQMLALCREAATSDAAYQRLQGNDPDGTRNPDYPALLDVPNYIDYLIVNLWGGNWDWPWKNWWAGRDRSPDSTGFKFYCWDYENTMGNNRDRSPLSKNALQNNFSSAGQPHQYLKQNAEYCLLFADRVQRLFFHDGPLTPAPLIARYADLASIVEMAIVAESARWGDVHHHPPLTQQQWYAERDWLLQTYLPQRSGIVLSQFRSAGLYPNIEAPTFQINGSYQQGGHVATGAQLSMTGGGIVWYTLDGTDPRLPRREGPAGPIYTLLAEDADKRVFVPTQDMDDAWKGGVPYNDSYWTLVAGSPGGVGYEYSSGYEALLSFDVEDQMYGKGTSCYIRMPFLLAVDPGKLSYMSLRIRYDDAFVAYLNGVEMQRAVFQGTPKWDSSSSGTHEAEEAELFDVSGGLRLLRQGENILAIHGMNSARDSSDFIILASLEAGEGAAAQGGGGVSATAGSYTGPITLNQSVIAKARTLSGSTWSALNEAVFAVGPVAESLRISEIMYHPADGGDPNDPNTEFIELTNIGSQSINLNLVRFTNGIDYTFPSFELPAGDYGLLVKDIAAFEARYGTKLPVVGQYAGSLNNGGECIELVDAAGQVIQRFAYDDNWFDLTDGQGSSLTVKDPPATDADSLNDKSAWRPSTQAGGSPGTNDGG
jgi:hypothetical protein